MRPLMMESFVQRHNDGLVRNLTVCRAEAEEVRLKEIVEESLKSYRKRLVPRKCWILRRFQLVLNDIH